jgi:hypothetical protein
MSQGSIRSYIFHFKVEENVQMRMIGCFLRNYILLNSLFGRRLRRWTKEQHPCTYLPSNIIHVSYWGPGMCGKVDLAESKI